MSNDGGLARVQAKMMAIPKQVEQAIKPTLMRQADQMATTMRQFAPDDPATGAPDLKTSIAVTGPGEQTPAYSQPGGSMVVPDNAVAITAGNSDVRYPHLQEYGTKHHAAQPFFWPSVRMHNRRAKRAIKAAIGRAVKKHWGGAK